MGNKWLGGDEQLKVKWIAECVHKGHRMCCCEGSQEGSALQNLDNFNKSE